MRIKWLERYTVFAPYVTLCLSRAEFLAAAKHCFVEDDGQWLDMDQQMACVHTWERGGKIVCIVCMHPDALQADPIEVAATLVHEAVHVFQRLCDSIGEREPSREFEAYSIERISEQLMREYRRRLIISSGHLVRASGRK